MKVNENIKKIARIKGVTISEICNAINMSESGFYTALLKNKFKPITLEKIANYFEISVNKLINYDEMEVDLIGKSLKELLHEKQKKYIVYTSEIEKLEKKLQELRIERDKIFLDLL